MGSSLRTRLLIINWKVALPGREGIPGRLLGHPVSVSPYS